MASTDSGAPEKLDAMPPEQLVGMARNGWTASIGIAGRHGPDYAACRRRGLQADGCVPVAERIQCWCQSVPVKGGHVRRMRRKSSRSSCATGLRPGFATDVGDGARLAGFRLDALMVRPAVEATLLGNLVPGERELLPLARWGSRRWPTPGASGARPGP